MTPARLETDLRPDRALREGGLVWLPRSSSSLAGSTYGVARWQWSENAVVAVRPLRSRRWPQG